MRTVADYSVALRLLLIAGIALSGVAAVRAQDGGDYERLLKDKSAVLVTVKYVLKMKMGGFGGDSENESELTGVMIDPKGLVLCSNTQFGGFGGLLRSMGGPGDFSATPTEIKVLVGDDTEGLEAELMARDTELDLAWVRIKEPGERTFASVDLTKSSRPKLGQRLVSVSRLGKFFDRVPYVSSARVGGLASKPRELFIPSGSIGGLGLPIYAEDGTTVGVSVVQFPDAGDDGGSGPGNFMRLMTGGGAVNTLILPAETVVKATQRAREVGAKPAAAATDPEKK